LLIWLSSSQGSAITGRPRKSKALGIVHESGFARKAGPARAPCRPLMSFALLQLCWCAFTSASNASMLLLSTILVGMMISLSAGIPDLSPSRYLAISFMP